MQIVYTNHAYKRINKKKVELIWVEEAIKYPDSVEKDGFNKYLARKKLNGHTLEVVYVKENYIKVVTAYWI